MTDRNRSEGWKYAKDTGHKNEKLVVENINNIPEFKKILNDGEYIVKVMFDGGKNQKKVDSVIGHKTTPKPDYYVKTNMRVISPSLKKSNEGQAYLVSTDNMIDTIRYYGVEVTDNVRKGFKLFTGEDSHGVEYILSSYPKVVDENNKLSKTQIDKRLNISAISVYDKSIIDEMMVFLSNNIDIISKIVLSMGSVKESEYHADFIFYKNLIEGKDKGSIYSVESIIEKSLGCKIGIGNRFGGTSFILPWGTLQMHKGMLQFRHHRGLIDGLFS